MTTRFPVHPDDMEQLLRIRRYLIGYRITNGWTQAQLSVRVNGSEGAVYDLESNDTWQWRFARLQDWVGAFDLRLDARLVLPSARRDKAVHALLDVAAAYDLSVNGKDWKMWQRVYLSTCLGAARHKLGLSAVTVAARLGVTRKAVTNWENTNNEILLPKVLHHARALGARVRLGLDLP